MEAWELDNLPSLPASASYKWLKEEPILSGTEESSICLFSIKIPGPDFNEGILKHEGNCVVVLNRISPEADVHENRASLSGLLMDARFGVCTPILWGPIPSHISPANAVEAVAAKGPGMQEILLVLGKQYPASVLHQQLLLGVKVVQLSPTSPSYISLTPVEELTRTTLCTNPVKILGVRKTFFPDSIFTKPRDNDPTVILKFPKVVSASSLASSNSFRTATGKLDLGVANVPKADGSGASNEVCRQNVGPNCCRFVYLQPTLKRVLKWPRELKRPEKSWDSTLKLSNLPTKGLSPIPRWIPEAVVGVEEEAEVGPVGEGTGSNTLLLCSNKCYFHFFIACHVQEPVPKHG
jgi:hypothetical protein